MICEFLRRSSQGAPHSATPSQSITIDSAAANNLTHHSPKPNVSFGGNGSIPRMMMPPSNMIVKHPEPKITLTASSSERHLTLLQQ